ncbi:MAG: ATP-binding protein [Cyanobacteria bacterium P01_D01_bin.1]
MELPTQPQSQIKRYEELLQGVAAATNILLTGHNYHEAINQALATLGQATGVDRTYIFETHPHPGLGKPAMSQRWEWTAPGVLPEIDNVELQNMLYEDFLPRWHVELSQGQPIYGFVEELPPTEQEILAPQGILSILVVPIQIRSRFWGFIGFDECSILHEWTSVEVSTLRAIAGCLGGAIAQHHTEQALQKINLSLEKRVAQRTKALTAANTELSVAMKSLKETQAKLIHTEKMSSLGQLVAGVAHEINNPTNFIHGNLEHAQHYIEELLALVALYQAEYPNPAPAIEEKLQDVEFDFLREDFIKLMDSSLLGVTRIMHVVRSLRNFSRLDEADCKLVDIHQSIESALNFLQHRFELPNYEQARAGGIEIIKQFDSRIPLLECFPRELNQAIMHVLTNAVDAIEAKNEKACAQKSNKIEISSAVGDRNRILIRIADSGIGMTPATQAKMFDPFFTAKPVGQGTGLGLSIAHQIIVQEHKGEIICHSTVGQGTTFEIWLPVRQH